MANYATLKGLIDQYITTNGHGDITGAVLNNVLTSIVNSISAGYLYGGVVVPSSNVGTPDQNVFFIATQGGSYQHFNEVIIPNGITVFKWNGSWSYQILFAGDGGVFDISAYHNNTIYADLTAALGTNGANVPQFLQKGGVSVKFVQNSNNEYVQYFLTKNEWSANEADWEKMNLEEEVSQLQQKVYELDKEVNIGGRTDIRTIQGTGVNQFFSLSDLGYPASGDCYVYIRVDNPASNFKQYGIGQGNNGELTNYRSVTWLDQESGLGSIGILAGFSQFVVTSAVGATTTVTILSEQLGGSLKSIVSSLEKRMDAIEPIVDANNDNIQEVGWEIKGGRAVMADANGNGTDQFFNREDVGYPMSQSAQYVYFKVVNPASNFAQYGMGFGNNSTLATYTNVEWLDQVNGLGRIAITNSYTQIVVTAAVKTETVVQILSSEEKESIDAKFDEVYKKDETLAANVATVNGRISGGETILRAINGNGTDQIIPLSTLGMKRPSVYLYFRVSGQSANFAQYGFGYSEDGVTLSIYARVNWVDQANGYGYISVRDVNYVVLTSANNGGVAIQLLDVSWNPGIESQVLALNQRVYGGHRVVFSIEGNGTDQFIKLADYGITPDENGRIYISVENPATNFNQYGIATSEDGKTLKQYKTSFDTGNEKYFTPDTPYIAVTSAVVIGTRVSFYSRHEDGIGKVYNHPTIVSFIDDDSGKYVPDIWGQILAQSPIRMGFACITGFMSGLSAPEIYEQMTPEQLKALYNEGHEVYSHSYTHPAFYDSGMTVDKISEQCRRSKDWLLENGYFRGCNIIVYPGGLGDYKQDKENVIRRFYKYGVDTTGYGVNEEPLIDRLRIKRFNADTATLAELKAKVDEAVASGHLLVFMNHAYELNKDAQTQIAKMVSLIEYIKGTTALILPLGEALNQIYSI